MRICLSPLLAAVCRTCFSPLLMALGIDPAVCGGILPLDVGGYQLAMELAEDAQVGQYAGIVNGTLLVCGASTFSAHLGFTLGVAPEMVGPMLAAKLLGGDAAVEAALAVTGKGRKW